MVNANYVMVDGFDLQDTSTGSAFTAGTNTLSGGKVIVYHHIAAMRNIAHDSGGAGLAALHADYVRFEGNTVFNNSSRSDYGDSGIDLWEMQASDTLPGFHIVIRNNLSYSNVESDIPANLQTDGEGIILDSFDYADPTYGTTPYAQESLVENNVIWGNGGRGIEASGAQPTSHVTDPQQHRLRRQHAAARVRRRRDRELGQRQHGGQQRRHPRARRPERHGRQSNDGGHRGPLRRIVGGRADRWRLGVGEQPGLLDEVGRSALEQQLHHESGELHDRPRRLEPHGSRPRSGRGDGGGRRRSRTSPSARAARRRTRGRAPTSRRSTTRTSRAPIPPSIGAFEP